MTAQAPKSQRGFTLVELALVVGVTAIVAGLTFSAYRTYAVRAQVESGVADMKRVMRGVEATFKRTGTPPSSIAELGTVPPSGSNLVDSVRVANGRIELIFSRLADAALAGQSLYLTPFETADQRVVWLCGNRLPGVGLNLLGFAGGGRLPEQTLTLIEPRFLPPACR